MSSGLTFTAYYTRQSLRWFVIGIIIYAILYVVWIIVSPAFEKPPAPPPIKSEFGSLQALDFPAPDPDLTFNYRLETISGKLPAAVSDRVLVYTNNDKRPSLFALDAANKTASLLGFKGAAIPIEPPLYEWRTATNVPGVLQINVRDKTLDMILDWRQELNLLQSDRKINEAIAFREVSKTLSRADRFPAGLDKGDHSFVYFQVFNDHLIKVSSVSEADIVQVNFRREQINELPVIHADPERPPVWGLFARTGKVVEIHARFHPNAGGQSSEYALRTPTQAWRDLLAGKAHIARIGENVPGSEVIIRDFYLAYYISNNFQSFTQPVYVIEGDGNFRALVPAVENAGTISDQAAN